MTDLKPESVFKEEKVETENFQALVEKDLWLAANAVKDRLNHSWPQVATFGLLHYLKKYSKRPTLKGGARVKKKKK